MWKLYFGIKTLEWRIPNDSDFRNLVANISLKYNNFHNLIIEEFGTNGLYILFLFIFFLIILVIVYCKAVLETFHNVQVPQNLDDGQNANNSFHLWNLR